jgi:hypothetical protein
MLRSLKDLRGFAIGAIDGDVGTVAECYFDDASFTVRYVVVETGGWLADRKVLLSPTAFDAVDWEHRRIATGLNKAQVESSPHIDTQKPVSRQHETIYFGHYGVSPYWSGPYLWGMSPYPSRALGVPTNALELEHEPRWNWESMGQNDPHLRSSAAVTGHYIQATDGEIGHVEDFLVDDRSWTIRFMVVDTTNWWAGEKVLIAPAWIERVDWNHSKVHVTLTRAQIEESPTYAPDRLVERAGEKPLYHRRAEPGFWRD